MKSVGVIGAGQMGAGIAQVSAAAGYAVKLADVSAERSGSLSTSAMRMCCPLSPAPARMAWT